MQSLDKNGLKSFLYLITPPQIHDINIENKLKNIFQTGVVKVLQLRLKKSKDQEIIDAGKILKTLCKNHNVTLIINDRPDLAHKIGADGVHIGEEDSSIENARAILGKNSIIGVSCYNSKHQAMIAAEKGADYVAFGAFYDSKTKVPKYKADLKLISDWSYISEVASVAIGGINADNCTNIVRAGADYVAVIDSIWNAKEGYMAALKKFERVLQG